MPSMNWCVAKIAGNKDRGIADLGFGKRAIATPLAASAPLATKLAVAEKHIDFPQTGYHLLS